MAQATQATQTAGSGTPAATAAAQASAVVTSTVSAGATVTGTAGVRPTPAGPTPTDPTNTLNVFNFFPSKDTLVRRDAVNLDSDNVSEMLLTVTGPSDVITNETTSALAVVKYDPQYREWNLLWQSDPIDGTASPLPSANRTYGYNTGDILHTGAPVFALRTTTRDRRAHLFVYQWDKAKQQAALAHMVPAGGGAQTDARFDADLDLNMADLNGDGVYEVVGDNLSGVQIWKWDGSKFVPEANR